MKLVLTLTLNPAVDVSIATERIVYDDRVYITAESSQPAGKGINAANVLHRYGATVEAIAPFGGEMGSRFANLLAESQIPVTLIPVHGQTRRNIAVTDAEGLTLKLDQRGSTLTEEELGRIESKLLEKLPRANWLTLTGSLPPGVDCSTYAHLIALAQKHGVSTLLDTTGEALPLALAAGPSLAKPNRPEAERLLGRSLFSEADAIAGAEEICAMGAERVLLSLGSQGAVAVWAGGRLRALPPGAATGSPIGAGDVLGAVCIWALLRGESFPEAFRWAVAAGTVAAGLPGLDFGDLKEVEKMRPRVEVHEV